jgi:hypothetical protein
MERHDGLMVVGELIWGKDIYSRRRDGVSGEPRKYLLPNLKSSSPEGCFPPLLNIPLLRMSRLPKSGSNIKVPDNARYMPEHLH